MDGVDHGAVRDLDVDEVTSPCLISATIGAARAWPETEFGGRRFDAQLRVRILGGVTAQGRS